MPDRVAAYVWGLARTVLDDAHTAGKLEAFAYSGNSIERWLVCEVYARLWTTWDRLPGLQPGWDSWMEAILHGQERPQQHIDLFVGEWEPFPPKPIYYQPRPATPVFEFKIVRSDDLPDRCNSVAGDVAKLARGGLLNKYLIIVYRLSGSASLDTARGALLRTVPQIERIGELGGPWSVDLKRYYDSAGTVTLWAEAFRAQR